MRIYVAVLVLSLLFLFCIFLFMSCSEIKREMLFPLIDVYYENLFFFFLIKFVSILI